MSKIAFSLGPLHFYWYGLIIAAAILAAFFITCYVARRAAAPLLPVVDIVLFGVPAGLVGARLYYVLVNWPLYRDNPLSALYLWQGGFAVYGALLGFLLAVFFYCRQNHLSFWQWGDFCAPGLGLAGALGQWANFFNQEAFGYPTDRPWGIYIDFALRPAGYEQFDFFHPVFMYESAWNLAIFLLLAILAWRNPGRRRPGFYLLLCILLFAAGHFYFAGMRLDNELTYGFSFAQLASGLTAAAALVLLLYRSRAGAGAADR